MLLGSGVSWLLLHDMKLIFYKYQWNDDFLTNYCHKKLVSTVYIFYKIVTHLVTCHVTFCHSWQQLKWANTIRILPTVDSAAWVLKANINSLIANPTHHQSMQTKWIHEVIIIMPFNQPWSITLVVLKTRRRIFCFIPRVT